ncbi:MAG: Maf family protein [Lachnospiraceae bacterium]|nr:Maf family protein [Lachnospiraceae bacterium]
MKEIILASASPRRKELLELLRTPFRVKVSHVEEKITCTDPAQIVEELAFQKAQAVAAELGAEDVIVLGSDTVVVSDGKILGKPADPEDAVRMLRQLQGRAHSVFTGCALIDCKNPERSEVFHEETKVFVSPVSEEEIRSYVATGEPLDKAGAYGIQGYFAVHIDHIEGDYYTVMGLPVASLYRHLRRFDHAQ